MTDAPQENPLDADRRAVLQAMLPHVAFDGWSCTALRRAEQDTGTMPGLFEGPMQVLGFWMAECDRDLLVQAAARDLAGLRIRERITALVRLRLEMMQPHREALRRALSAQMLPGRQGRALRGLFASADAIWHAAGDNATDFNWYTKRALLSGVYASTLLYWLNDDSEAQEASWEFLDRRIADVMRIQGGKGRVGRLRERLRPRWRRGGEAAPA